MTFHGSYAASDVEFLLKPVNMPETNVLDKERAIQSGRKHYSEMLSPESTPDERYMSLFYRALDENTELFAQHIASLARTLSWRPGKEVVLVSLVRAGTPVGVLLNRALTVLGRRSKHYSISIIRDRGVDEVALDYILSRHEDTDVVFIDGWTGKGAIACELTRSVGAYNRAKGTVLDPALSVVADLAGVAGLAATSEDYLIPSAILNSTISGLVSRSVLNDDYVGPGDFHACLYYQEKRAQDLSRFFVDHITPVVLEYLSHLSRSPLCSWDSSVREALMRQSDCFMAEAMQRWAVSDRNRVKPGIGESTRALLRRVPERLIVRDVENAFVQHLLALAQTQGVPVEVEPALAYRAAVIIKTLGE